MKPDIDAIKDRVERATPGPWEINVGEWYGERRHVIVADTGTVTTHIYQPEDALFITHARTDIPALLAYIAEQDKRIAELEQERDAIHRALKLADELRSKARNNNELAVSNGLALGRIAVITGHEF